MAKQKTLSDPESDIIVKDTGTPITGTKTTLGIEVHHQNVGSNKGKIYAAPKKYEDSTGGSPIDLSNATMLHIEFGNRRYLHWDGGALIRVDLGPAMSANSGHVWAINTENIGNLVLSTEVADVVTYYQPRSVTWFKVYRR